MSVTVPSAVPRIVAPSLAPEKSNDLRGDLPYFQEMQSRKASVAENAHVGIAQPLSVPQSDFVCADGAGGSVGQKLPQPQQQGAHTIATNTGGYILAQAPHIVSDHEGT